MSDANAQYRDSVFRSFFNEPTRLLSLCNAVLGTNYDNPAKLEINTLEGIFLSRQKNDISCAIDNNFLVPVEHQTSVNNNMPFRFLSYVAELLNNFVKDKDKIYREQTISFPAPKFFVLYDGDKAEPVEKIMRLSDAFGGDSKNLPLRNAIIRAVNFCLDNGIMGDYLVEHSEEVFHMLALEWNLDDAKQAWQEEAREQGIRQGEITRAEKIAGKMIRRGRPFEEIHELTDLPLQRIQELAVDNRNS